VFDNGKQLDIYYLVKNSCIFNIRIIAGKGAPIDGRTGKTIRNIDNIDTLIENYGGEEDGWFKATGNGYINVDGEEKMVEIHWFEHAGIGAVDLKIKGI
jgi:hypothetical protein